MTANEARDLVAKFKANGMEIGQINLEIKKLAEQGGTAYRHGNSIDRTRTYTLAQYFQTLGFKSYFEFWDHPQGTRIYNLVIDWS